MQRSNSEAILTIAGTDSSGGAGIQADLKTFTAHLCYGASVITALTAQNTLGVQAVHGVPPEFVEQQMSSVLSDIEVRGIKTGMLFDADNTRIVAQTLKNHFKERKIPLVCDPVCVSTSGHVLLHPDAINTMIDELFPFTTLVTPNKSEAEILLSQRDLPARITNLEDMLVAARNLLTLGPEAVLLKGGHIPVLHAEIARVAAHNPQIQVVQDGLLGENMEILQTAETAKSESTLVVDVLCQSDGTTAFYPRPRLESTSTHGTGCTLSAAITCQLGKGKSLMEATRLATAYTHMGIENAAAIGSGYGPLNHLHSLSQLNVAQRSKSNPYPLTRSLIRSTGGVWKDYVQHDFVKLLGKGTLPKESFLHFIKKEIKYPSNELPQQDYHYLKYYARAYALLAAKSHSFGRILQATETVFHIARESSMHKSYCAQWGITEEELENTAESPATTAYGAYLIDTGLQGDSTKLVMALAACLLGYGEVGLWLKKEAKQSGSWVVWQSNPYLKWMEDYSGEEYQKAVRTGLETIESRAAADPPSAAKLDEWRTVWEKCTRLEKGFWDMALSVA
ncbi:Phosphomethylpyrimidine kinase-domain-containing protein [Hygrophoropsis aurantiaca]|uniref:Phosphomethylpyrimidine kinase-domain-containing protein n=1 Tax=Hygrophoropsis aurantiaca TaxID=72124 RepID=A0ACB7ZW71_9AGAM|nr:Phosphomethylpyrimidine kinase-domain-containing protein [Hygrophoropsis aurantiaca]